MGAIHFDVGEYLVAVSTHGYFRVLSKSLPSAKFSDLPGELYMGSVDQLGHGIRYTADDDVEPDIEDSIVERACHEWVDEHRATLSQAAIAATQEWEERAQKPLDLDGVIYHVGDRIVTTHDGQDWQRGTLLDIAPDSDGLHVIHYQNADDGSVSSYMTVAGNGLRHERPAPGGDADTRPFDHSPDGQSIRPRQRGSHERGDAAMTADGLSEGLKCRRRGSNPHDFLRSQRSLSPPNTRGNVTPEHTPDHRGLLGIGV